MTTEAPERSVRELLTDVLTWTHAASAALRREDPQTAYDAIERAQHAAFEAKAAIKEEYGAEH